VFSKRNVFLYLLKISHRVFILPKMRFLISTENEILLFPVFGSFEKIFLLKLKQKFNQTHFHYHFLFLVKMKTENNQIKHPLAFYNFL